MDYSKAADRAQHRAERVAEIEAIDSGTWPRDINDSFRWGSTRWFASARHKAAYARKMCEAEVAYIDGVETRIKAGDPSVADWEVAA